VKKGAGERPEQTAFRFRDRDLGARGGVVQNALRAHPRKGVLPEGALAEVCWICRAPVAHHQTAPPALELKLLPSVGQETFTAFMTPGFCVGFNDGDDL
jgi:hypothetical protein